MTSVIGCTVCGLMLSVVVWCRLSVQILAVGRGEGVRNSPVGREIVVDGHEVEGETTKDS